MKSPDDDKRLLIAENRRALARLRAIRTVLEELARTDLVAPAAYMKLWRLTREDQG